MKTTCLNCNKTFNARPYNLRTGKDKFCSKDCYTESQKGKMPTNIEQLRSFARAKKGKKFPDSHPVGNRGKRSEEYRKMRSDYMKKHPIKEFFNRVREKASEETKKKMSLAQKRIGNRPPINRGDKAWNWKGGISRVNKTERQYIMSLAEYRLWRKAVFERDNYTCVWCGRRGVELNADHIKPWCDYPELRFAIDNGRTLCVECHRKTETYGGSR